MRGFWYMLEALIAGIIILGFLAVVSQSYISPASEDFSLKAYGELESLDERGVLRSYAVAGDWGGLNSEVRIFSKNHTIEICDPAGSCEGQKPQGTNVWIGSYLTAGDQNYQPLQVKLYLW